MAVFFMPMKFKVGENIKNFGGISSREWVNGQTCVNHSISVRYIMSRQKKIFDFFLTNSVLLPQAITTGRRMQLLLLIRKGSIRNSYKLRTNGTFVSQKSKSSPAFFDLKPTSSFFKEES